MKSIVFLVLLTTTQYANALSAAEQDCLTKSLYHEGRSLTQKDWRRMTNVVLNRAKQRAKTSNHLFGAKSSNVCDIVKSREFTTHSLLHHRIHEPKAYAQIKSFVKTGPKATGKELFFSSFRGKMRFR
jgi:alpha-N-acetylglucosamine transferase